MSKQAIIILGGAWIKDTQPHRSNPDSFRRIVAAYYLYKDNKDRVVIVSSGDGYSATMRKELLMLGIPNLSIFEENKSTNTYDQLLKLQAVIKKLSLKKVLLISSGYHLSRIKTFINYRPELKNFYRNIKWELVSAEKIIQKEISAFYKSKEMKEIKIQEKKGVTQIKNGTYKLRK